MSVDCGSVEAKVRHRPRLHVHLIPSQFAHRQPVLLSLSFMQSCVGVRTACSTQQTQRTLDRVNEWRQRSTAFPSIINYRTLACLPVSCRRSLTLTHTDRRAQGNAPAPIAAGNAWEKRSAGTVAAADKSHWSPHRVRHDTSARTGRVAGLQVVLWQRLPREALEAVCQ